MYFFGENHITYRIGDRVIQIKNNYDKNCFNGDTGFIISVSKASETVTVKFDNGQTVDFIGREEIFQLELAYALTIHKSQGSEYPTVIIPIISNHKRMLSKNLLYTGVTRAKKNVYTIGMQSAWQTGVTQTINDKRLSKLYERII